MGKKEVEPDLKYDTVTHGGLGWEAANLIEVSNQAHEDTAGSHSG